MMNFLPKETFLDLFLMKYYKAIYTIGIVLLCILGWCAYTCIYEYSLLNTEREKLVSVKESYDEKQIRKRLISFVDMRHNIQKRDKATGNRNLIYAAIFNAKPTMTFKEVLCKDDSMSISGTCLKEEELFIFLEALKQDCNGVNFHEKHQHGLDSRKISFMVEGHKMEHKEAQ